MFTALFVFTVKKRCVLFIYFIEYIPCREELSCAKIYFFLPARNYKAQSGLAIKIEIYIG